LCREPFDRHAFFVDVPYVPLAIVDNACATSGILHQEPFGNWEIDRLANGRRRHAELLGPNGFHNSLPGVETARHDDLLKRRGELFFQKDAVRGVIQKGGHKSLRWSISKPTSVVNGWISV
jgi:hypothetical protein